MIIGILNQKGGVGKTTLSLNLAFKLARVHEARVLLLDADEQGSATDWSQIKKIVWPSTTFDVISYPRSNIHRKIERLSQQSNYVHLIIDGPPRDADIMRSIILASDVILIPITPSPCDVWATEAVIKLIDECNEKQLKPRPVKAAFVLNRRIANTAIGRDVISALKQYPLPVLSSCITQRVIFAEAAAQGLTVYEVEPNGPAAREIDAVENELKEWMNEQTNTNQQATSS